jgi:serine/threonine protein kinase
VYRGFYSGTAVAAKVTFDQIVGDDRKELDREFRVLASLHHPNIVAFFGMARDRERGALYNVQELCTGGDLGQFLARHPPPYSPGSAAAQRAAAAYEAAWSKRNGTTAHSSDASEGDDQEVYTPETLAGFAEGLLAGVKYMHENGFAHRDLKPENGDILELLFPKNRYCFNLYYKFCRHA